MSDNISLCLDFIYSLERRLNDNSLDSDCKSDKSLCPPL